jgi:hypothetical protein
MPWYPSISSSKNAVFITREAMSFIDFFFVARGTNAWTDVDHTAYTISTAGEEAFLQILPVFLDHVHFLLLLLLVFLCTCFIPANLFFSSSIQSSL